MTVRNALDRVFEDARRGHRGVLMPYLTAGFPDRDGFVSLALGILDAGADVLELGVPFSDPLLDGPAIQRSQQAALDAGVTPGDCIAFLREIHAVSPKPVLLMGAYNPILAYGQDRFCRDAAEAGASGLIVPDLPFDEQEPLRAAAAAHDLHVIQMVAPTSTDDRLQRVCALASGFVYCISVAGVTGTREGVADLARPLVERIKRRTEVPVAVGFGVSGPEQARAVATIADGAIVGTALINTLRAGTPTTYQRDARAFVSSLAAAVHAPVSA